MSDITSPRWLYAKAGLFVLLGSIASGILLLDHPSVKVALLLGLAIWSFARAYYFAFYVIEHYIDPSFKFSGLGALAGYLVRRRRSTLLQDPASRWDSP